jgi:hypothetical protein
MTPPASASSEGSVILSSRASLFAGVFTGCLHEFGVGFDHVLGGFAGLRAALLQALHLLGFVVRLSRLPALPQDPFYHLPARCFSDKIL